MSRGQRNYYREPTPREQLLIRIGQQICAAVYGYKQPTIRCDCMVRGRNQICDAMRSAAEAVITEISRGG